MCSKNLNLRNNRPYVDFILPTNFGPTNLFIDTISLNYNRTNFPLHQKPSCLFLEHQRWPTSWRISFARGLLDQAWVSTKGNVVVYTKMVRFNQVSSGKYAEHFVPKFYVLFMACKMVYYYPKVMNWLTYVSLWSSEAIQSRATWYAWYAGHSRRRSLTANWTSLRPMTFSWLGSRLSLKLGIVA